MVFPLLQVFINYGPHSNTVLLLEYGFLLPHNQQDGISLQLSQVKPPGASRSL